jgi:intracellular sulfur oxidation DsrE/DsrF family protein
MEIDKELERQISPLLSRQTDDDPQQDILLLITSETIGNMKPVLGRKLMNSFLYSLTEMPPRIRSIIFINGGVKLAFKNAKSRESLSVLHDAKVGIIICEESLHYYGDMSNLALGRCVSMYTIADMLLSAQKVISI